MMMMAQERGEESENTVDYILFSLPLLFSFIIQFWAILRTKKHLTFSSLVC